MLRSFCALMLLVSPALAEEGASAWSRDGLVEMRLIDGGRRDGGTLAAGIEIRLAGDAKTYWRTPGDSGVAPEADFAASANVASAELRFPAPARFSDGGGESIGYRKRVVLPVIIAPKDVSSPTTLRLKLQFAVCEKLCLPAQGEAELAVGRVASPAVAEALARVPEPVTEPLKVAVNTAKLPAEAEVSVPLPADAEGVDLFIEGPDAQWALPLPTLVSRGDGHAVFRFALDGVPKSATLTGAALKATLVYGDRGREFRLLLP